MPYIKLGMIKDFEIPLPPIEVQQQIVDELEGYQKIIDGCRQVVENYKPTIDIDPSWEMVELSKISEIIMGQSPAGDTYNTEEKGVPLINGPVEFGPNAFSETIKRQFTTAPTKMCKEGDLILCVRGSTTGRMNISGFDACIGRGVASIRSPQHQSWINYVINSYRNKLYSMGVGSTFPNISKDVLTSLKVPTPPEDIQAKIIKNLDYELSVVDGNRHLIDIYTQKIQDRISKVWGD